MTKKTVFWLVLGTLLVIIGLLGFVVLMGSIGWDFTKLGTSNYETNTYEIDSDFTNICINVDTADITFVPSEDGKCKIACHEDPDDKHLVFVDNNVLNIASPDGPNFSFNWLNFDKQQITIYLPKIEYSSLSIDTDTGSVTVPRDFSFARIDIYIDTGDAKVFASADEHINIETDTSNILLENLSTNSVALETDTGRITVIGLICSGDFNLDVSTGKANVKNTNCLSFFSEGDTGDIHLESLIADEKIYIKRDTGDVTFSEIDAAEINIDTDTGDIEGSLLSGKIFTADTDTGNIRIPVDSAGGTCKLTTNTGDIKVTVAEHIILP